MISLSLEMLKQQMLPVKDAARELKDILAQYELWDAENVATALYGYLIINQGESLSLPQWVSLCRS